MARAPSPVTSQRRSGRLRARALLGASAAAAAPAAIAASANWRVGGFAALAAAALALTRMRYAPTVALVLLALVVLLALTDRTAGSDTRDARGRSPHRAHHPRAAPMLGKPSAQLGRGERPRNAP